MGQNLEYRVSNSEGSEGDDTDSDFSGVSPVTPTSEVLQCEVRDDPSSKRPECEVDVRIYLTCWRVSVAEHWTFQLEVGQQEQA